MLTGHKPSSPKWIAVKDQMNHKLKVPIPLY